MAVVLCADLIMRCMSRLQLTTPGCYKALFPEINIMLHFTALLQTEAFMVPSDLRVISSQALHAEMSFQLKLSKDSLTAHPTVRIRLPHKKQHLVLPFDARSFFSCMYVQ